MSLPKSSIENLGSGTRLPPLSQEAWAPMIGWNMDSHSSTITLPTDRNATPIAVEVISIHAPGAKITLLELLGFGLVAVGNCTSTLRRVLPFAGSGFRPCTLDTFRGTFCHYVLLYHLSPKAFDTEGNDELPRHLRSFSNQASCVSLP